VIGDRKRIGVKQMTLIKRLSSSTGKRNKVANKALAKEIADTNDRRSISELCDLLKNKDRNIQSDSIEVLYETGYLRPDLIAGYSEIFIDLLKDKNNRLVWGAMIALSSISKTIPEVIFQELPKISQAVDKGSVITKDAGMALYANLATVKSQKKKVLPVLFKELKKCPEKQLAQYAEKSLIAIDKESKDAFVGILNSRLKNLEKESQIKRVRRVLKEAAKA
jgi:hypothetical protein